MEVDLLVAVEDLVDGLFRWHFQYIFCLRQRIDDLDVTAALGELANVVFLVLPPWNQKVVLLDVGLG